MNEPENRLPRSRVPETKEIAVEGRGGAWLLEVQDEDQIQRIPLGANPVIVGSARACDIVVSDETVSARHCELAVRDGGVVVRDLGSKNGTYVGGARVKDAWGTEGTMIVIGQTTIACLTPPDVDESELGPPIEGIAGNSIAMCRVAMQVRRLAKLAAPVLIVGETGVGKELIARALHDEGQRTDGPFIALNVAALPRDLVESELFGHERGAFTGAVTRRPGAFTEAEGGTLFLDEIGELPLEAQPKLLRALDGYEVRRIGSSAGVRATARVVAATHVPLIERVKLGEFRRDLYHRLEVFVIEVPPLRDRPGDILPIARVLLSRLERELGARELTPAAIALLAAHDWPGNVRELRNVLYRAADLTSGERWISAAVIERALRRSVSSSNLTLTPDLAKEWLMQHRGNVSAAARAAGIPRSTFRKMLQKELF